MSEFNQIKYQNDFNKEKYDRITIMVPKGEKDIISEIAKRAGMSRNEYIYTAIQEKIEKEQ